MKLAEIFRFEIAYQIRRPWPWLAFVVLVMFTFFTTRIGIVQVTLPQDFILNSPFIITTVSVLSCQIWLLVAPAVAGEAAARDVSTGMHPLMYTSSVSKAEYLGGRFLAALVLNAMILLGVQAGSILAAYAPGVAPEIIGPFRPAAYLTAFALIALPNVLIATTVQFSAALLTGRPMAAYVGSLFLFFVSYPVTVFIYFSRIAKPEIAMLTDSIGVFAIMNEMMSNWTIVEKNVRPFVLEGTMLWNRILWVSIALVTCAVVYGRFRFAHRTTTDLLSRVTRRFRRKIDVSEITSRERSAIEIPRAAQSFGVATKVRQMLAIASSSFWMIAKSPAGLFLLAAFPVVLVLVMQIELQHWGVPMLPRTFYIATKFLTGPVTDPINYWVMIPLIIIYFAGELIWRERDARISENVDATPVQEWVLYLGKYLGLALVLFAFTGILTLAGIFTQVMRGYFDFQLADLVKMLFGLQLVEYLLFAALAFAVQVAVNHKYVGQLAGLVAYFLIVFSGVLGIEHNLLVYGASPEWSFTDLRGFGRSVGPWVWFKLYWAAWALLLGVATRVLWVRGNEGVFRRRLQAARHRFSGATAGVAAIAAVLIVTLGGFVFYNTNVLNKYRTDAETSKLSAEYERRYGRFAGVPQPQSARTQLQIEIYPDRGTATIRGTYRLVNRDAVAIDSLHIEPASFVTTNVTLDRAASRVHADDDLGHDIYSLAEPLQPGDSMTLSFDVRFEPRGFRNSGASNAIVKNGSYFTGAALPAIGYQAKRELMSADDRRAHGLPRKVTFPAPDDVDPHTLTGAGAEFEAVVGTDADQVAIAPGELRRSWTQSGRRYFQYASDIPISGLYVFFSAKYATHLERWKDVEIRTFLDPRHTRNRDRMLKRARASLEYYSAQFGPYPYRFLQIIEQPSKGMGMGVDGSGVVTTLEGVSLLNPKGDGFDAVYEIMAHEMGHQWWGVQLKYAAAEGAVLLSESLAWYSGMQLVKHTKGREALRQFMQRMREPNPWPPIRTGLPLLRAMDPYAGYRRGPYAFHALSEYIGEDRVNGALRDLLRKNESSIATTLELYDELKAATPDSLKPLLSELFEKNTYWTFDTKKATAVQTKAGTWQVTFDILARKVMADSAGVERDVPINDMVEIGIFAAAGPGEVLGRPLHVEKHRIRSGRQTITVTVAEKPARGGIDPYNLLDWEEGDNIEGIATGIEDQ